MERSETGFFTNERGRRIYLRVAASGDEVRVVMRGPDSTMTDTITRREAEELRAMLGRVLNG